MHMVTILNKTNSLVSKILVELRDKNIQLDASKFRSNLQRLGNIFAYEISKTLKFKPIEVETTLGISKEFNIKDELCIVGLLRAGLPLHLGFLEYFPIASNGFISANRHLHKHGALSIELDYMTVPDITGKVLVICDAMIATGSSMTKCLKAILETGKPSRIHIVAAIASVDGVNYVKRMFPGAKIWIAAMDEELTAKSLVVPGLGDAGDLSFGEK